MSWLGIVPPTVTTTSPASCSRSSSIDARDERHVRAGQDREADGVGVLLQHGLDDLLRRLVQAGVDDLHAGVAQRAGDDLRAAVVAVEAGLGHDDADLPGRSGHGPDNTRTSSLLPRGCRADGGIEQAWRGRWCDRHAHPDAADLLRTEHAVVRVLASAARRARGLSRRCWRRSGSRSAARERCGCRPTRTASCAAPRRGRRAPRRGASLVGRGAARRRSRGRGAFAFPLPGVGVMAFATAGAAGARRRRCSRRWRASARRSRSSSSAAARSRRCARRDARKTRDPRRRLRLHHHDGPQRRRRRGQPRDGARRSATARRRWSGASWPTLIVPPALRDGAPARRSSATCDTGATAMVDHPLELDGDARRRQRVPGRGRDHARRARPARRCSAATCATSPRRTPRERELRRLLEEQAALRRVATAVAAAIRSRAACSPS